MKKILLELKTNGRSGVDELLTFLKGEIDHEPNARIGSYRYTNNATCCEVKIHGNVEIDPVAMSWSLNF